MTIDHLPGMRVHEEKTNIILYILIEGVENTISWQIPHCGSHAPYYILIKFTE